MSYLFSTPPASYAEERLSSHLSSLSTLPINLPPTQSSYTSSPQPKPSPRLQSALSELSTSRPLTRQQVIDILKALSQPRNDGYYTISEIDRVVEAEVLSRAVTVVWKEVLEELLKSALELEEEREWWDASLGSRRGVGVYLLQTLPIRLFRALPPRSSFSLLNIHWPQTTSLFKPLTTSPSATLSTLTSPYALTRREMLASRKSLTSTRNSAARRIGLLASQGPKWGTASDFHENLTGPSELMLETSRIYGILCQVLEIPPPPSPPPSTRKSRSGNTQSSSSYSPPLPIATPHNLLVILQTHLPKTQSSLSSTLSTHHRPNLLTRYWFPLLFLPPIVYTSTQTLLRNKDFLYDQLVNAKETIRGFAIQWVWEPLEGIGKTIRGGGEGLGVVPTTVKSDQESLERMVRDLGRDYYHLKGDELAALGEKVRGGDMEEVLRVYEKEMQSPVKNALLGSLVRTLLIQVQKTKTDLSLSLLSLDHLLRSQQLTFAFVGVAPSVLILYGLGGYLRNVWRGEKRGKGRRKAYFNGLRDIERLLITAPKKDENMSDTDRGLLILGVSGMRSWAAGLGGSSRDGFLDDLRMVEDPVLSRGDKLRVVERIWRCWGVDGRRKV